MKPAPVLSLLLAVIFAAGLSCGGTSDGRVESPRLLVAAAADLRAAFREIGPEFERRCDCRVEFSFGSSGMFATQILEGLPADVFFSADVGYIDTLDSKGAIISATRQPYAMGLIVLATPADSAFAPARLEDLLGPQVSRVAIANSSHAPYGVAAREALMSLGLWDSIQPKLVFGENASQATQFVVTGNASAGIVPLSLAIQDPGLNYVAIDDALYAPLRQGAAVIASSGRPQLALSFIEFINGSTGQAIMTRYGFLPPE